MMKNFVCAIIAAYLALCGSLHSQPRQGEWEASLSGSLSSLSESRTTSNNSYASSSDQESRGFISLALRPGFFITEGLEIEPEILWTAMEGEPPAFCLTANLAYNVTIPSSHITPFILAGYGTANAVPLFQRLFGRSTEDFDISVLNAGAGIKFFIAEGIALRTEYRYQKFNQESTFGSGPYSYTTKQTLNFHNVFIGFSVFL